MRFRRLCLAAVLLLAITGTVLLHDQITRVRHGDKQAVEPRDTNAAATETADPTSTDDDD